MTPERWRQIESLCHAALLRPPEDRAGFLAHACEHDTNLLQEVESLLAHEPSADLFMGKAAFEVTRPDSASRIHGRLAGCRLGAYAIGSLLGVGGMGEVYRARDETLGRDVALKVLTPVFASDPERRARFEREARVLASLNHPNIASIHGIEYGVVSGPDTARPYDGRHLLALILELVEGQTLAERVARSPGLGNLRSSSPRPANCGRARRRT